MEAITLQPIGVVQGIYETPDSVPLWGQDTTIIELYPQFLPGLLRVEEHSHFWILSWFDKAVRNKLTIRPERISPTIPEYGVFALRTPARPNPVALSLVKLEKIEGNKLYVSGFDAIDGTPIIDIKPYFENDVIFSPRAPYLRPSQLEKRCAYMFKEAMYHHQEDCLDLRIAIRMGLIAEEQFGKLNSPDLMLEVTGSLCLGDVLQGLSRARLSNPPRFSFTASNERNISIWSRGDRRLSIELIKDQALRHNEVSDAELFTITIS
ncbi:MAG: tRNA (N6-threonylcarbamoyladenosine(37)-N6)-methyltransferase TrmO [Syntrophomonadaceae bacterium]